MGKTTGREYNATDCVKRSIASKRQGSLETDGERKEQGEIIFGKEQQEKRQERAGRETMEVIQEVSKLRVVGRAERAQEGFLEETPSRMLEREFMILTIPLVEGTVKEFYPTDLLSAYHSATLRTFRYLTAGVRLRFVSTSGITTYGFYIVSWLPDYQQVAKSPYSVINADPTVVDIGTQEVLEMKIPFITRSETYRIADLEGALNVGPYVRVTVNGAAVTDSSVSVAELEVYASYINPRAYGARGLVVPPKERTLIDKVLRRKDKGEQQCGNVEWPTLNMTDFVDKYQQQMMRAPIVEDLPSELMQEISMPRTNEQLAKGREMVVYEPGGELQQADAFDSAISIGTGIGGVLSTVAPEIGIPIAGVMQAVSLAKSGVEWAMDKYNEYMDPKEESTMIKNESYGVMSATVNTPSLLMDMSRRPLIIPRHLGDRNMFHSLGSMIMTPCLSETFQFKSTDPTTVPVVFTVAHEPCEKRVAGRALPTYLDMLGQIFRYWRGSTRLMFTFHTSPMMTAQYVITAENTGGVASLGADDSNLYRKVVTVRGTTKVALLLPFASVVQWKGLALTAPYSEESIVKVTLKQIKPPNTVGDKTGVVYVLSYVAGGPDFQFKDLRSPQGVVLPSKSSRTIVQEPIYEDSEVSQQCGNVEWPELNLTDYVEGCEQQMNVRAEFRTAKFENISGGASVLRRLRDIPEDALTFEDISRRFSDRPADSRNYSIQVVTQSNQTVDLFDFVQGFFRFVRGAVQCKIRISLKSGDPYALMPSMIKVKTLLPTPAGNGYCSTSQNQNILFDFEVPYQNNVDWEHSRYLGIDTVPGAISGNTLSNYPQVRASDTPTDLWVAGGKDYQLNFLMPPYDYSHIPSSGYA